MSWTDLEDKAVYHELRCGCGHSFFAHDSSEASNPMWHLGPCRKCNCYHYVRIDLWLNLLAKAIENYNLVGVEDEL